ncbi:OLC1v1011216C1 [Oldenlandia corymbosa var. corymbosa]|uniref:WAT1-related protein n=1 Tax=Oldenlandia corymbosa var. corymbosa TaxID=529605 RepID=A0AAV1DTS1_OLDCO|nr:OLC1v1011216C1 [Oldenlandia corymbosa var. corymbosa]
MKFATYLCHDYNKSVCYVKLCIKIVKSSSFRTFFYNLFCLLVVVATWEGRCTSQIMGYTGITYSSPTLASAISNLVPAFTFILAIIFRMEKLAFRNWSCRAKVLGTIVSVGGAFIVTLYKGPKIVLSSPSSSHAASLHNSASVLASQSNWALGGLFLTAEYILVPMWYIVQTQIMKEYPAEVIVVCFYNLCVSIMAAVVGVFTEPDTSKWRIRLDIALASIICSGIFGSGLNNTIHTWALRLKGPVFVAMFKPLSIAIAVAMGVAFLGDTLYLGSILGATVIVLGFYTVMWGKAKEEMDEEECNEYSNLESSATDKKSPLLQNYRK